MYENVDKIFHIRPSDNMKKSGWFLHSGSETPVPKHILPALESFTETRISDASWKGIQDARVRMVILTVLANRKRNGHVQNCRGIRTLPPSAYESLKFETDQRVELLWTYRRRPVRFVGTMRYCLRRLDEPYPLFIIDDNLHRDHTLAYLDMIHHARKEAGLPGRTIYGLTTDSYEWYFIRVEKDATYTTQLLSGYLSQWEDIVSAIGAMIDHAAGCQSGITLGPADLDWHMCILTPSRRALRALS
ncbi:hypothetical protein P170DRAFT_430138 [Aspergillus steynii IBT 23096]|uniref:Uncharacterized protein n=1 Tax=Aspergillus steynii IBT 23096 TaxID=1392250 RepID=A0A2I2FUD4_9EURO|nr:uncharacterized protein P170DRAFT_430138 [Aspergillus steynii IBT 23096]PLB44232.1 hypothetical protein P170DRAFT_430138 [Aspergillus steynii IBT 23096]